MLAQHVYLRLPVLAIERVNAQVLGQVEEVVKLLDIVRDAVLGKEVAECVTVARVPVAVMVAGLGVDGTVLLGALEPLLRLLFRALRLALA